MPFELRPRTGARTPSPDSSQTPAPRADGNSFFKDLAKRRAARMQVARNAYEDAPASRPKARIPMPQTPAHYTPPDTISWRLGIEEERQARREAALAREQEERVARLREETDLGTPVYGPQTQLQAARARGLERSQARPTAEQSRAQHEENLRAIERQQILQDLDALQHRTERPAKAREALIDDVYNFDEPVARPLEPTPEGIRRNKLAESRQKMEARQARANDPELTFGDAVELDSDLLEDDDAPILTRGEDVYLPQEDVTDLPRRPLAEKSTARRTDIPPPFRPLSRADIQARQMTETVANLRANQAAAQESANAFKGQLSHVTEATQTLADDFEKRFGVNLDALQHGGASLLQELKVGAFNIGASLGKLFGKKAESPQSFIDEYKKKTALLSDLTAEQRKYMDDARRLQRQIDEIVDPEGERLRRERAAVEAHFRGLGRGRGIAPHEGSVLDTVTPPRTIPQREQLVKEDPMPISSLDAEMSASRSVSRPETAPSREPKPAEPEDQLDAAIREFRQKSSSAEHSPESIETRTILNKLQDTRSELATLLLNADPNSPAWMQRVAGMKRTMRELTRTLHPDANPSVTPEITRLLSKIHTVFKDLEKLATGTADAETTVLGIVRALNAYDQEADQYTRTLNPNTRQGINQPKEHFVNAALLEYQASGTSIPLPIQKHGQTLRGTITRVYPTTVAVQWRDPDTGKTERLEVDKTALLAAPFQR
jgi:hypothetical protein